MHTIHVGVFPVKGGVSALRASKGFTNVGKSSIREAKLIYVLRTERVTENSWLVFSLQLSHQSLVSCFTILVIHHILVEIYLLR